MPFENILFALICLFCALVFGGIAFWAFNRKDPMHFYSGTKVYPEEIRDIPAYNRANGIMWTIYTLGTALAGITSLYSVNIGAILLLIVCIGGLPILILTYHFIYNKYKNTDVTIETKYKRFKGSKAVTVVTAIILIITLFSVGALFYYGEKEPTVNILDYKIQIDAMYGLTIETLEIEDITLIEASMIEIGVGRRVNGYGGFGQALKGNFESLKHGKTVLFVQSKSSPTIKIKRHNQPDIYISYRNSEQTKQLYHELREFFN